MVVKLANKIMESDKFIYVQLNDLCKVVFFFTAFTFPPALLALFLSFLWGGDLGALKVQGKIPNFKRCYSCNSIAYM
jgi:hypothetical protein